MTRPVPKEVIDSLSTSSAFDLSDVITLPEEKMIVGGRRTGKSELLRAIAVLNTPGQSAIADPSAGSVDEFVRTLTKMYSEDTSASLFAPIMPKKPEPSVPASAAPSWAESSLQWLRENHPVFLAGRGTAIDRLAKSLRKMSFDHPHLEPGRTYTPEDYDAHIGLISRNWERKDHDRMVQFLKEGGFVDRRLALEGDDGMVIPGTEIDLNDLAPAGLKAAAKSVAIDMTPEDDLRQVVEAQKLESDDRWGAW